MQTLDFLAAGASGAVGVLPASAALADGTHTLVATVQDTTGRIGVATLDFAVRGFTASPPIGANQFIWFDFEVDRNGDLEPDFPSDLRLFGLGSLADPALSAVVVDLVREATMERIREAYWDASPAGLPDADPVAVGLFDFDPGAPTIWDTTRICVGGEDPTGGSTIGNILIDPNNTNRTSIECGSLPPTGIFPAELMAYASQSSFQHAFDPLMASRGGTPVGEHPLDAIVLDPGFDYGNATLAEQERYDDVFLAIERFGDALGSISAHEAGHALGLVPPGPPGSGLYGGQTGAAFSHAVTPAGGTPSENHLMKAGGTFNFARLTGQYGYPLPFFRPLSHAYLRDRVRTDARITALWMPPSLVSVAPQVIAQSSVQITITGTDLAGTPIVQLVSPSYTYAAIGETLVGPTTATAWVIQSQLLPGLYDLVYSNGDGQTATLPDAISVP
jgi:hypothetical protein